MKVWLDCDPGHDDMLAIIMAALSEGVTLLGVSTSAGNSTIQNTTRNALDILHEIGREDVQVVQGAEQPLCCKLNTSPNIHGESGLEGAELSRSPKEALRDKPFLHIYSQIMAQEQPVEFVVTGSLTNLATILRAFPDIHTRIRGVTLMGGAIG
jgi:inosine-uridine nucleoside N-ribohydrolase